MQFIHYLVASSFLSPNTLLTGSFSDTLTIPIQNHVNCMFLDSRRASRKLWTGSKHSECTSKSDGFILYGNTTLLFQPFNVFFKLDYGFEKQENYE